MQLRRLVDRPIIESSTHPSIGHNIQGPSLLRVPEWLPDAPGRYLLYFADHKGDHLRLAYADDPTGPWTVVPGGALHLVDSHFLTEPPPATDEELADLLALYQAHLGTYDPPEGIRSDVATPHIASPDVRVNDETQRIEMYFHGLEALGWQTTRFASSTDGRSFTVEPPSIPHTYLRAFRHGGTEYALVMPGDVLRRTGGPTEFETGPSLFPSTARHSAVRVRGDRIEILWTNVGDAPERLLLSIVDAREPWTSWSASDPVEVLRPERTWEGAGLPEVPSVRGAVNEPSNQLRDPAFLIEDDRTLVVYAVAGESGLAIAEVVDDE
jgi:hypothetical protein